MCHPLLLFLSVHLHSFVTLQGSQIHSFPRIIQLISLVGTHAGYLYLLFLHPIWSLWGSARPTNADNLSHPTSILLWPDSSFCCGPVCPSSSRTALPQPFSLATAIFISLNECLGINHCTVEKKNVQFVLLQIATRFSPLPESSLSYSCPLKTLRQY